MAEYWQNMEKRAQATIAVWQQHFAGLSVGTTNAAGFVTLTGALPGLAQARDNAEQGLDEAREARDTAYRGLQNLNLRVPKIIAGRVDPEGGVIDDLDKVYAIRPRTFDAVVARGRRLLPVWTAANDWLAAEVPPLPAIECGGSGAEDFSEALDGFGPLQQAVANAGERHDSARDTLRGAAREVEKLCSRFYKMAKGMAPRGTPAEAALDTLPTRTKKKRPSALPLRTMRGTGVG